MHSAISFFYEMQITIVKTKKLFFPFMHVPFSQSSPMAVYLTYFDLSSGLDSLNDEEWTMIIK